MKQTEFQSGFASVLSGTAALRRPELLSPAGNAIALQAAVQNGADAVYLGLSSFNARASAANFTLDTLKEHIDYAHVRGVKIHITLNILLEDSELESAAEFALAADRMGADAFIIQDIGLAAKLRGKLRAAMHASTQMTVYNTEGLKELKELGFSRAVLARELSLPEITKIVQSNIMETEVFCHGALCMSYSGQCMLSRFTCGRSGNRGNCSQPCRLQYALGNTAYENRMSPADLCSLPYIKQLIDTGVSSLKIEGRLKSPEYTAAVTRAYRKAIDDPDSPVQEEIDRLTVIFSRGGFSSGHQLGKMQPSSVTWQNAGKTGLRAGTANGSVKPLRAPVSIYEIGIITEQPLAKGDGIVFYDAVNGNEKPGGVINIIKQNGQQTDSVPAGVSALLTVAGTPPVFLRGDKNTQKNDRVFYKTLDAKFYEQLRESFKPGAENKRIPLTGHFTAAPGNQAVFTLTDPEGRSITVRSEETVQKANGNGLTANDVSEKLSALGGTPFFMKDLQCEIDAGVFIGFPALKALRRNAVTQITQARTEVPNP